MKKPSRFLRVLGAAGLLISLLAATVAPAAAQDEGSSQDWLDTLVGADGLGFRADHNTIYYPWVSNGENFGLGPSQTSISIQNLEDRDTIISIAVGNADGGFDIVTVAYLSAYASKTFTAAQLGIAEGSGAPVEVFSFNESEFVLWPGFDFIDDVIPPGTIALVETPVILSNPVADDEEGDDENDGGNATQVVVCVVNYFTAGQQGLGNPFGYVAAVDHTFVGDTGDVDVEAEHLLLGGFTQDELQDTLNEANEDNEGELINPFAGINNDGDCGDVLEPETLTLNDSVAIGGVAKQTAEAAAPGDDDEGAEMAQFTTTDTSVSGYNALNGVEIAWFDEWYLPIVQTNGGPGGNWNSLIRVANYDSLNNAVTVRFFPADDGSGSLQTGFQVQALVNGGDTWNIDLSELVPPDWVGSAHIYSDGAVFAMVDRYKVGTNMWITNTGSSADFENLAQVESSNGDYVLFAPHVLIDYFGWNTGINVANLVNMDNNISIQYFNLFGNASQVLNQRLAAHGMTYFYDPSVAAQDNNSQDVTTDPNAGVVGSALIWSDYPVAAAVDATKYEVTDPNGGADVGHATSYSATANMFPWQAVPYVTKGNPIDGSGATSGINIMNANSVAATANVYWVNPSGFLADNFGTSSVTIPAFANGFVYTLWQENLPNGFLGAAQVVANVPIAAVSANVNYDVAGDGSAIFNAFNPCGMYRTASGPFNDGIELADHTAGLGCHFGDVFEPGGQSVTKYFVDANGDPVTGVNFSIESTSGAGYQRDAVSGVDGAAIMTNVPVGTYELTVNDVPAGYVLPEGVQESFVVVEGDDVVLTNELEWDQGFTKLVCVANVVEDEEEDEEVVIDGCTDIGLVGIQVVVYQVIGLDTNLDPVVDLEPVFLGETGPDGTASADLAPGEYILCIYKSSTPPGPGGLTVDVQLTTGEDVDPDLIPFVPNLNPCIGEDDEFESDQGDYFEVVAGEVTELENPVLLEGIIDVFVGSETLVEEIGAVLAEHAEDLEPVEGVEMCIQDLNTGGVYCDTSDENGHIQFEGMVQGLYDVWSWNIPGIYQLECVEGSDSLEWLNAPLCGENNNSSQLQGFDYEFTYDPAADLQQDGVMDDINDGGVYDATVELSPNIAG